MREVERKAIEAHRARYQRDPQVVASAPGRINLIGEHTDYNGGYVLPCAIDRRVAIAASIGAGALHSVNYGESRSIARRRGGSWSDYPSGVAWAMREAGHAVASFQAAFSGDVQLGAGLSSSAAIEAATALALDALFRLGVSRQTLALLCQRAENVFVGVNSGIMDQYASLLCRANAALLLDCRSLEATLVPLDLRAADLALLVCDTRVERTLAATGYNERRATCERAARMLGVKELRDAGLADLQRLTGEELKRARHVVSENARVPAAAEALQRKDFAEFGRLLFASHASLRDNYEVSTRELDDFVDLAAQQSALGARLTGAGFGGCAIALLRRGREESLAQACRERFAERGFKEPAIYSVQPAPGAEILG